MLHVVVTILCLLSSSGLERAELSCQQQLVTKVVGSLWPNDESQTKRFILRGKCFVSTVMG